jgi:hypothetical protein
MRWLARLVVTIAALVIGPPPQDDNNYIMANGQSCPPQGDDPRMELIALDLQKNRATIPAADDIDGGW